MDQEQQTSEGTGEPMEVVEVALGETAEIAGEPERGPILATLLIRVTIREQAGGVFESPPVPTNAAIEELVEAAFRAGGYAYVNATAEKV